MSSGWYATYNDFGATWGKAIGAVGIAIYQSLASRAWDGQCFPSYQTIADDTGVSRPTAIKYIKILQQAGLIEVQPRHNRRGDPSSNLYTLSHLPSLKKPAEAPVKTVTPPAITDTSNLSEAEIAELARKSHFVSRPQKKSVAQSTATVASNESYSEAETTANSQVVPIQSQTTAPTPNAPKQSLNFGLLTDEKDQIKALHLLKGVPNKQEVLDELNKAIREQRIQTTAIQYLAGLVKKVMRGEFVPSANKRSEDELLMEKKKQAAERDKTAKQAIAACSICNSHGYLIFTETDTLHFKSAICSHDQKAKEFTEKLLARERKGEVVTYFGKEEDNPDKADRAAAIKTIHDAMSLLSDTSQQRPAVPTIKKAETPRPTAAPTVEPVIPATPPAATEINDVSPQNRTDAATAESSPENTKHSFKSIGAAIETALERRSSPDSSSATDSSSTAPPQAEASPEELTVEELAELEQEITELAEYATQVVVSQGLLPESEASLPTLLSEKEEDERLVKLRLEGIRAEIKQIYDNEIISTNNSIIRYLKLQIKVKLARARQLVRNSNMAERNKNLANQHLATVSMVHPRLQTIKFTRIYLDVVEQIIEMLRRTKLSEQLANAIQERNILKKNLAAQQVIEDGWKDKPDDSPAEIASNRHRNIEVRRSRIIAAIEDEHPELQGDFLAIHELLPIELKLTPAQIKSVKEYYEARQKALQAQQAQNALPRKDD